MAKLALNDGLRTQIFRKIVRLMQTNPILHRTIKPSSWYVWDGRPDMKDDPFTQGQLPAIRMTPISQGAEALTNVRFRARFGIKIEIGVSGLNMDDIMNLWDVVHASIFTGDGSKAALQAIQTLSASVTTGIGQNVISLGLSEPGFTPRWDSLGSEMIVAEGGFWVEMMVPR